MLRVCSRRGIHFHKELIAFRYWKWLEASGVSASRRFSTRLNPTSVSSHSTRIAYDKPNAVPLIERLGGSLTMGLTKEAFIEKLESNGINRNTPKFKPTQILLDKLPDVLQPQHVDMLKRQDVFVSRAIDGELVIKDFQAFTSVLSEIYEDTKKKDGGHVATYIPQLAKVNPDQFGVSVCSIDGQQWKTGDSDSYFCIQSISKAITYIIALEENGEDFVHVHVGREPSGVGFNERILNAENLPHNPYINSGAIMCCSLVKPLEHISNRFDHVLDVWTRITGGARPTFANSTYLSERSTADRNFCLAYMMHEANAFPPATDLLTTLEFYFMLCSIELTTDMLSVAAGTLASGGVCPVTGERVFSERNVRNCLSLMASCGMYDASGEFIFDIGFPAKSGVAGGIMIVIPGTIGMATFSPRLEGHGNSYRGVRFCAEVANRLDYHQFSILDSQYAKDHFEKLLPRLGTELLFAVSRNNLERVRVCVALNPSVTKYADYDNRTPLHVAASYGYLDIVKYLIAHGASANVKDYLNNTPIDDAIRHNHSAVASYLRSCAETTADHIITKGEDEALFAAIDDDASSKIEKAILISLLSKAGFNRSSYWESLYSKLDQMGENLTLEEFKILSKEHNVIRNCISNNVAIAEWENFTTTLQQIFNETKNDTSGDIDKHIPPLARVDPEEWEMSFCSTSGQLHNTGSSDKLWCAESLTNIVNYLIAQELLGEEKVHQFVGKEPGGRNFNEFSFDARGRPHNPTITSGALMVLSLILPDKSKEERLSYILSQWNKLSISSTGVSFHGEAYVSETSAVTRKWTLAYMMLDSQKFPASVKTHDDLRSTIELYFMTTSLLVSTERMALIGAVLANGGVNPFTHERLFNKKHVRNALSIMSACGMYDWSGEFTFRVGIPAQSSVGGGILAVVPDLGAFCTWSPRLDQFHNSVRGVRFFCELTKQYNFHAYEPLVRNKKDPSVFGGNWNDCRICHLLGAASKNDVVEVKKELSFLDVNSSDYDDRTALHVAAENNHAELVNYLLENGADPKLQDRWGHTPSDNVKLKTGASMDVAHEGNKE